MNEIKNIEELIKEWIRAKTKEELLSVQRKEIEKNIQETLNSGVDIDPKILNLLHRVLRSTKSKESYLKTGF